MASEWTVAKLHDVAAINPRRKVKKGEAVPFIEMAALPTNGRDISTLDIDVRLAKAAGSHFQNGDTLLARITPCLENGKTAQVKNLGDGVVGEGSTEFIVLCGQDSKDNDFIYYLSRSVEFREFAIARMEGTSGRQRVAWQPIAGYEFTLPPPEVRREAASLLSKMDDRIDNLRQTNVALEAIAQALFKSWFVDFDPVRAKAEGLTPIGMDADTAALFPSEFEDSDLGPIPKGWNVTSVGAVAELIKGCSYKGVGLSNAEGAHMFNLGCFNAKRIFATENIKRYTDSYRERQSVVAGDLIMANTDMTQQREILGRALFVPAGCEPGFVSHHVFKVSVRRDNPDGWKRFLFFAFQQSAFRERAVGHATGTTVLALARDSAEMCPIIEPDEGVLAVFDKTISPLLTQIANNLDRGRTLEGMRDTLLPRLISGKLRLPEARAVIEEEALS